MLTSARLQIETTSILITFFGLAFWTFSGFALIQRGSVFFWMHVHRENGRHFLVNADCSKILSAGKNKSRAAHRCAALQ
jgi:hypothetical protein